MPGSFPNDFNAANDGPLNRLVAQEYVAWKFGGPGNNVVGLY
jgi:hypothetical protein